MSSREKLNQFYLLSYRYQAMFGENSYRPMSNDCQLLLPSSTRHWRQQRWGGPASMGSPDFQQWQNKRSSNILLSSRLLVNKLHYWSILSPYSCNDGLACHLPGVWGSCPKLEERVVNNFEMPDSLHITNRKKVVVETIGINSSSSSHFCLLLGFIGFLFGFDA